MANILVTGFEPFGGEHINPSWEVVRQLDGMTIGDMTVIARQLPCEFGTSLETLYSMIDELMPQMVIGVGQAGGRAEISLERVAINIDDARIPDNLGYQPIDVPVVADAPAAYFATLPIKALVQNLRNSGIPAAVSQTTGTFVCNHVMYGLLHYLKTHGRDEIRAGFVHIPYLPEQAVNHAGAPSMSIAMMIKAIGQIIALSLTIKKDLVIEGGATH
ncbi:MAG: pyroglutamyl-peptidase I [Enterobacteriaceae bacterium]|jgi:pyroglutamyl-peptidase|nr:pyroglutamyl-peptidase I [Enterobacteriaceae bacterium]